MASEDDHRLAREWDEHKTSLLAETLGPQHNVVMHAIVPYVLGGALDLYYFPNGIPGTAIATKEMSELPGQGPSSKAYKSYELVMFTRHALALDDAQDESTPFGRVHCNINRILNLIARYAETAQLNPLETCEFPEDMEHVGGKCLIFDGYARHSTDMVQDFGLLAIIEIFRSEMEYAQEYGGATLIARLKEHGHYPYSDLDREPVA